MDDQSWTRTPIEPQSVNAPLSTVAIFLVVTLPGGHGRPRGGRRTARARGDLGARRPGAGGRLRAVNGHLSCTVGIGSDAWARLAQDQTPAQLRLFFEIVGPVCTAVATPGDLLFPIRAERQDMCFDLERLILEKLVDAVTVVHETHGFRYFDSRDLLDFVDGSKGEFISSQVREKREHRDVLVPS